MSELAATGLEKSYRKRKVVCSLSLTIGSGEVVGLLGPNGAGKTTAFYMIVGLVPCDGGSITLDGEDITSLPMHARARRGVGYLPQEPSIFRRLTVSDNVKAILETRTDLDGGARDEALESLLEELHVAHLRDHLGMSLSGGERRRVEIARALADVNASAPRIKGMPCPLTPKQTEAIAMARNYMGNSAEITMLHQPMIGIADME